MSDVVTDMDTVVTFYVMVMLSEVDRVNRLTQLVEGVEPPIFGLGVLLATNLHPLTPLVASPSSFSRNFTLGGAVKVRSEFDTEAVLALRRGRKRLQKFERAMRTQAYVR